MEFSRSSAAWCPITGKSVGEDTPRVVDDLVLENASQPVIYYKFPESQGFTAYSQEPGCYTRPGETTDYYTDLADDLESNVSGIARFVLGTSEEGRNIDAFRLGPVTGKHFIITCVCHGNETDGLSGSFKGFEILCNHPDFQPLRDEFTLFFVGCWNPDGHYNNTRFLSKYGPHPDGVDKPINLNREWPNFWTEYSPTSSESKGATPLSSDESLALYNYITTGNGGSPISVSFLLDQHSTVGDGFRYQSRDRQLKDVGQYDWNTVWADWVIYGHLRATQAKRIHEDGMPDLLVNFFRSRFRPHWHAWVSNISKSDNNNVIPISIISEHNKVGSIAAYTDKETYQSACNYNMDYVITSGRFMQNSIVRLRGAVLVEHEEGDNKFENSEFDQWNKKNLTTEDPAYRPSYWNQKRGELETIPRNEKHMSYHGRGIDLNPSLVLQVPETDNLGPDGYHHIQEDMDNYNNSFVASNINGGGASVYNLQQTTLYGRLDLVFTDVLLPNNREKRFIGADSTKCVLLDLGDGASEDLKVISYESPNYSRSVETTYTESRVGAAVVFDGSDTGYIIGGHNGTSKVDTVLSVSRDTYNVVEFGTNLLPTADYKMEAVFCNGGELDGYIVTIGGDTIATDYLKITLIDTSTTSAYENFLDVSSSTLPDELIGHALSYDGYNAIRIYGGQSPSTNKVHYGVWKIEYNNGWTIEEQTPFAGFENDGDPEDYSGEQLWNGLRANWKASTRLDPDEGTERIYLLGGVDGYSESQDPDLSGDYRGFYIHDILDDVISRPQDSSYSYFRLNSALDIAGYDKASTTWSFKAGDNTEVGYVRINNAPGNSISGDYTTRRIRTYYMHPPRWWWRESASLDFTSGRPDVNEDEWRSYVRVYRDNQNIYMDSPMVQTGTLWPSSWSPKGIIRGAESAKWSGVVDPRFMRVKLTLMPSGSFLNSSDNILLCRISDGVRKLEVWSLSGDRGEYAYKRNYLYGPFDPKIQLRVYDDLDGYESCDIPVYWGGFVRETAQQRFDTPISFEVWQHVDFGSGILINNSGAIAKNSILTPFDKSDWINEADVELLGGGWWCEPEVYTISNKWIGRNKTPFINGALLMGDRDPTRGKVNEEATFRYVEDFNRDNDSNLGENWDIITQQGNGFDIVDGYARCSELGWEKWDADPSIRDCSISGMVMVDDNGSRVGFFSRLNHYIAVDDFAHGYLGTLYVDGVGDSFLQIEKLELSAGSQTRSVISSAACTYSNGQYVNLKFLAIGNSLSLELMDSDNNVLGACSTSDSTHNIPGSFGVCGESISSSNYIYVKNIFSNPEGSIKVRITE